MINERIRAREVRVLSADGRQLGVVPTTLAIRKAKELGLDLVLVATTANPPVCRITDYGKWKYEESKKEKERKKEAGHSKKGEKEVKFRVGIDQHDKQIKLRNAERFLMDGYKLRIPLQFRGRQHAHPELGFELLKLVEKDLSNCGQVELPAKRSGRGLLMTMSPLPEKKRSRRWTVDHSHDEHEEEVEDPHDDEAIEDGAHDDQSEGEANVGTKGELAKEA